jgi:hypothetical protein
MEKKYIFESPDKGKTVYRRPADDPQSERELVHPELKIHPKADFILYAKGHYEKRTVDGTIWGDLRRIQAEWTGISEEHISENDIVSFIVILTEEVVEPINLLGFLTDITPEQSWKIGMNEDEYSLREAILLKCLSLIRHIPVYKDDKQLIELGQANPEILPIFTPKILVVGDDHTGFITAMLHNLKGKEK